MLNWYKTIIVILTIFLLTENSEAQDQLTESIEISFGVGTVKQYLDSIQNQLDAKFVYSDIIQPDKPVEIPVGVYTTSQLLDSIFINQSLKYINRNNFIILSPSSKFSNNNERIIVAGKVVSEKQEPVSFASIYIENRSYGTIANAEGAFRFILPSSMLDDTITISSIGFESVNISLNKFLNKSVVVELKDANYTFKAIEIQPIDVEHLVMDSYWSKKNNYSNKPVFMEAFFREASKQDDGYISLTEAIIEINKSAYTNQTSDVIRLKKGRSGSNVDQSELVNLVVEGGLYNSLKLDVVKNGSYFYGVDALAECDYKLLRSINLKNRQTYVVSFSPKKGVNYAGYEGKLYIDTESLALVRVEFNLSKAGVKYARNSLVKKSPYGFVVKPIFAKYIVEYRFYNKVWNLHSARSEMGVKVKKVRGEKNKGFTCNFNSSSEFVITSISDSTLKKIPFSEAAKSTDVLVEQVKNSNFSFWAGNNIILPEEPLTNTIKKLSFKNGVASKKDVVDVDE